MPTFIEQKLKRNCGHIAVACITDTPLEKVYEIIGHKHGTNTRAIIMALRTMGWGCPNKVRKWKGQDWWRAFGIAQVRTPGRRSWHWVVIAKGKNCHMQVFDGERSGPMDLADYCVYMEKAYGAGITSFLPVLRPAQPVQQ